MLGRQPEAWAAVECSEDVHDGSKTALERHSILRPPNATDPIEGGVRVEWIVKQEGVTEVDQLTTGNIGRAGRLVPLEEADGFGIEPNGARLRSRTVRRIVIRSTLGSKKRGEAG